MGFSLDNGQQTTDNRQRTQGGLQTTDCGLQWLGGMVYLCHRFFLFIDNYKKDKI